jgi:hypothetical protein
MYIIDITENKIYKITYYEKKTIVFKQDFGKK